MVVSSVGAVRHMESVTRRSSEESDDNVLSVGAVRTLPNVDPLGGGGDGRCSSAMC